MKSFYSPRIDSVFCIIITLFIILSSCQNKKPPASTKRNLSEFKLQGKVKSLTEIDYRTRMVSDEIRRGDMISKSVCVFDENGKIIEDRQYNSEGKLSWRALLKYGQNEKLIEKVTYYDSIDLKNRVVFIYDKKDNLTEETSTNYKDELEYKVTYKHDRKGNMTEKLIYRPAERFWNIAVYYDANKNIKRNSSYTTTEAQITKYIYRYDQKRNRVEEVYFRPDGSRGSTYIETFDDKGNRIESDVYGADDSLIYKTIYKYDEKGNVVERSGGSGENEINLEQTIKYDSGGNPIEEINYNAWMISKSTNLYMTFDKENNWLIRRVIVSSVSTGKQYSFIETAREIVYY